MSFWRRLLAGSEWSHLLGVLSPSFFDVVSARELSMRAVELAGNWFDRVGYLECVSRLSSTLGARDLGLEVVSSRPSRSMVPFRSEAIRTSECPLAGDGAALLRLFFLQIATSETVFLDLRAARFCRPANGERIVFYPLPLWVEWQQDFVDAIRKLYAGFYGGQSEGFEHATRALGVSAANAVFERAFGGERKTASRYLLSEFRETFQQVFVACRDQKTPFHPDLITLGVMLATLYDHLETLGGVYDVQAAYQSVHAPSGQSGAASG
jgi:hypothetical protein